MQNELRKTTVTKRIGRKIQPRSFESLEIVVELTDEIEWSSLEERQKKLDNHAELVLHDYNRSFDIVCKSMGLSNANANSASVKHTDSNGKTRTAVIKNENINVEEFDAL